MILRIIWLALVAMAFGGGALSGQTLVINEIMSSNSSVIPDEDGDFEDWIELYNGADSAVSLLGFCLSDNLSNPGKWTFPDVEIPSDEFLLVFASGKDRLSGPYLHTNFCINIQGEAILLSDPEGNIVDQYEPVELTTDNSFGRKPDGSIKRVFFSGGTPGCSNNQQPLLHPLPDSLWFSHSQGFYVHPFFLRIHNALEDAQIRYTLNGSDPTPDSPLYSDSLYVSARQGDTNSFATIPTNPATAPEVFRWKPPAGNVFKGTAMKVRSFYDDEPASEVYCQSFFVDTAIFSRYRLPVISIITDSLNLFDYLSGIYIPGLAHDLNPGWENYWGAGNYFKRGIEWERDINMAFFEAEGVLAFQQNAGARIHGYGSRALSQKTFRVYARNIYGKNTFDYNLFPEKEVDEFRRFLLRNGGNAFLTNMLADALSHRLIEHLDMETQSVRPSVVFINGEFWGIHHIRDRIDKYYLEYTCGVDPDSIDFLSDIGSIVEGDNQEYMQMTEFIKNHDLAEDTNYLIVAEQINVENYIDYVIAKQFIAEFDWPGNNIKFWRSQQPEAKWRWLFYDNDFSFNNTDFNALEHATLEGGTQWPNPDWSTLLFRNLLKNEHFKHQYLTRFEYHLLNTFTEERITFHLDSLLRVIEPVMQEHIHRWQFPKDYAAWDDNIQKIRTFARKRPCIMVQHLIEYFGITDTTYAYGICDTLPGSFEVPEDTDIDLMHIFPNPASGFVFFSVKNHMEPPVMVTLTDLAGREVKRYCFRDNHGKKPYNISLRSISSGTYILRLSTNTKSSVGKLVVH